MSKPKGWKDLPDGGMITEAGNAAAYNTGAWRSDRPIWIKENCIQCLFCWIFCPDSSVKVKDGEREEFDYLHCKGCGVCALECPAKEKAIVMLTEAEGQGPDALEKAKAIAKKMAAEKKATKE
jgi:pyruvate ferredoxin oxidoreductase delta subunit